MPLGIQCISHGARPTCQLCGKYYRGVVDYWHMFHENFTPTLAQSKALEFSYTSIDKLEATISDPQAVAMMTTAHEYSLLGDIESLL